MAITTEASASITAENTFATLTYVPPGARVVVTISGISGSTVQMQAQWNGAGSWEAQKSWTADPTEAEHFDAPRACALRIGIPTGSYGSGTTTVKIGFDYPVRR